MMKQDSIPMLTPERVSDPLEKYPDEVLKCEWNPALEQVIRLREKRSQPAANRFLSIEPPDSQ